MRDEPDVRCKIAMYADGLAQRLARPARVQILIRGGRHVDDSLTRIWAKLHGEGLAGMTMLGRHLLGSGQLRDGIAWRRSATCGGTTSRSTPTNG